MKWESIAWSIPERNRENARSKEVAVAESMWSERETESLIGAAQEQALRTNAIANGIDHQDVSPLCRLCKEKVECVIHIVSSFSVLAGNQYRKRHDKLGKKYTGSCTKSLRLNVKTNGSRINQSQSWKNDKCKLLWDFATQTDKEYC